MYIPPTLTNVSNTIPSDFFPKLRFEERVIRLIECYTALLENYKLSQARLELFESDFDLTLNLLNTVLPQIQDAELKQNIDEWLEKYRSK